MILHTTQEQSIFSPLFAAPYLDELVFYLLHSWKKHKNEAGSVGGAKALVGGVAI